MRQTTEEVFRKLEIEYNELAGKIDSLERFFISDGYEELSKEQKELLIAQHEAMLRYKMILITRIHVLRKETRETNGTQKH